MHFDVAKNAVLPVRIIELMSIYYIGNINNRTKTNISFLKKNLTVFTRDYLNWLESCITSKKVLNEETILLFENIKREFVDLLSSDISDIEKEIDLKLNSLSELIKKYQNGFVIESSTEKRKELVNAINIIKYDFDY